MYHAHVIQEAIGFVSEAKMPKIAASKFVPIKDLGHLREGRTVLLVDVTSKALKEEAPLRSTPALYVDVRWLCFPDGLFHTLV